jgi:hypothetical protein
MELRGWRKSRQLRGRTTGVVSVGSHSGATAYISEPAAQPTLALSASSEMGEEVPAQFPARGDVSDLQPLRSSACPDGRHRVRSEPPGQAQRVRSAPAAASWSSAPPPGSGEAGDNRHVVSARSRGQGPKPEGAERREAPLRAVSTGIASGVAGCCPNRNARS